MSDYPNQQALSRRGFLGATLATGAAAASGLSGGACAPAAAGPAPAPVAPAVPAAPPAKAQWESDWDSLMAAAKSEGKLSIFTIAGGGYRKWIDAAGAALPGIAIEHQQLPSSDQLATKITTERQAGVYTFDVLITSPVIALPRLRPAGVLDELRALLFRPDVLDDKAWTGGFEAGWLDSKKGLGYAMTDFVAPLIINTDLVSEGELKSARDLLNPKWKGKLILQDVRGPTTNTMMTSIRLRLGDEAVKRLLIDQEPTFTRDNRQIAEALVRGRYAIGNALTAPNLQEFLDAGLGKNVKLIDLADASHLSNAFAVWLVNRAPDPNAAKLFVNWVLTKEGQQAYSSNTQLNSRRTDVAVVDPSAFPRPGQYYFRAGPEDTIAESAKTQNMLYELMGIKN